MKITNMILDGFQEFDSEHSLVLFCHGCNFKCDYCYNYDTVTDKNNIIGEAKTLIDGNINPMHTAVVLLGGEPTIYGDELIDIAKHIKSKGLKVKLFTNLSNPGLVIDLIERGLLDSISMDVKWSKNPTKSTIGGIIDYVEHMDRWLHEVSMTGIDSEVRITLNAETERSDAVAMKQKYGYIVNRVIIQENFNKFIKEDKQDVNS